MNKKSSPKIWAYLLVTAVVLAAVVPLLIPIDPPDGVQPLENLLPAGGQYVDADGIKLYYRQSGVGQPAFILLHGMGASTYSWHAVFDAFAGMGTAVAYDRPGFGYSERPEVDRWMTDNPYSNEAKVEQLWALMDTLGIQQAVLVGHSAGGAAAIQAALERPERVQALILIAPAVYNTFSLPDFIRQALWIPQIDRLGPLLMRGVVGQGDKILENAWHDPSLITTQDRVEYLRPFQAEGWDNALWEMVKARGNPGISKRLDELSLPVLVVSGDDDHVVPIWNSQRLARAIPDAQLVIIEACGHMPQEEKPEEFLSAVDVWLSKSP
jgi:pimeloyl-ACP methyl ester carboxylesterase